MKGKLFVPILLAFALSTHAAPLTTAICGNWLGYRYERVNGKVYRFPERLRIREFYRGGFVIYSTIFSSSGNITGITKFYPNISGKNLFAKSVYQGRVYSVATGIWKNTNAGVTFTATATQFGIGRFRGSERLYMNGNSTLRARANYGGITSMTAKFRRR